MTTRNGKSPRPLLEKLAGGPLTLGMAIRATREGAEMTQAGFARKIGVTRSYLCDLEKERKTVSPARAAKFARVLGFPEQQYVRLALQDGLRRAGLSYAVEIRAVRVRAGR
ncbi:MAG: helix-turn-helix transcriptional regulator [Candidatus Binatia bacterium]